MTNLHGKNKKRRFSMIRIILIALIMAISAIPAYAAGDVFDKIDTDGSKMIDKKEYTDSVSKSFDRLDKNKDGYLSRKEFKATGIPNSDKFFDELDTNRDGKISKDEFEKGADKHFKIMDKNNDGFIDKNEFNLYQAKGRDQKATPIIKPFIIFYF
jgi:Ca2+-binding EF-hand superfamily protein